MKYQNYADPNGNTILLNVMNQSLKPTDSLGRRSVISRYDILEYSLGYLWQ